MSAANDSERLLVLAPLGRDAALTCRILHRAGLEAVACASMADLCSQIPRAAGAVLITEEALATAEHRRLFDVLAAQPPWSDLPLLVFASAGAGGTSKQLEGLKALGNATLLERPFGVRTLVSAVNAALRARRRQYDARRAIEQRDHFLAMLGHELRNPLAAIGLAVAAFDRAHDPAAQRRHMGIVRRQSEHLTRLVDDLLDVSRMTSGKIELRRAPVDLNEAVGRCVADWREPAEKSGLSLTATFDSAPVVVEGDAIRLEQVFTNLLHNAVKYTPTGGRIHVTVAAEQDDAVVRVTDTGVGLTADVLSVIFEPFAQVPGSIDRARGGLGIGLTLVRRLVDLHGGSVEATSAGAGAGSEFVVRIPMSRTAARAPTRGAEKGEAPARRRVVVVVDDSADVRESLREWLELLGHQVETAADGPSGLERIVDVKPNVALVDVGLPRMDGYEVARRAREALGDRVRLFALTGYGQPADRQAALQAGFDRHFTKPVDVRVLESVLHEPASAGDPPGGAAPTTP